MIMTTINSNLDDTSRIQKPPVVLERDSTATLRQSLVEKFHTNNKESPVSAEDDISSSAFEYEPASPVESEFSSPRISTLQLDDELELSDHDKQRISNALLTLNFTQMDAILSTHPRLTSCHNAVEHQELVTEIYWKLLFGLICAYQEAEDATRHYIQAVIFGCYIFVTEHGVQFQPHQHTDLVIFMAQISSEKALSILRTVPEEKWTEQCHAIAYHLEWKQVSPDVFKAEHLIIRNAKVDEIETEVQQLEDPSKPFVRRQSLLDCAIDPNPENLQQKLRERHWLSLRIKFETAWRHSVEAESEGTVKDSGRTVAVQNQAIDLIESLIILATHFKQYEYGWYWSERCGISQNWRLLIALIRCCRESIKDEIDQKQIWRARGWTLYKQLLESDRPFIYGNPNYSVFMYEFTRFVRESETREETLISLPRLYSDMLIYSTPKFFPISDTVLQPLMELCWDFKDESKTVWKKAFQRIFEVYILFKYFKSKRDSAFKDQQYFTAPIFVLLLKLCTATGSLEEFRLLNQDILLAPNQDDNFIATVKKGYTLFIAQKSDHDLEEPGPVHSRKNVSAPSLNLDSIQEMRRIFKRVL
ncbi:hypothetical protein BC833DRAFT_622075 [Globomyces pollinis-pini]|nr:hypothetical protein BC833DRAFT_622075 [Globomyces pollinis-pini]